MQAARGTSLSQDDSSLNDSRSVPSRARARALLYGVFALLYVVGFIANLATSRVSWVDSAIGIVVGGGIFWAILEGSLLLTGREGMGGGDVKLGAMLGAFLGWKVALLSIFLAVLLGGIVALVLLGSRTTGRKDPIPFGPFLAAGGAAGLFCGERLVTWYMSAFAG